MNDRTKDPKAREALAKDLREIRQHYARLGKHAYGRQVCRAVLGNFYTGLACAPNVKE